MTRTRRNKRTWRNRTKEIKKKKRTSREKEKKRRNRKRSVLPSPSFFPATLAREEKVYSNVLSYRDKDRNKDVPALRREGETHTITEVEEGARTLKRENGQGCSYHVSPLASGIRGSRKSLVTQGQGKNRLQRPPSLSLSLSHARTHAHNPFFPPYTHWSRDGQV